jgi:general secretion pathway protein E
MNASLLETPLRRLPFSFAKRHGVVFVLHEGRACLAYRADCEPVALAEAQRFAGRSLPLRPLAAGEFALALGAAYQHDSASMQLAEDIGGSLDLVSLAEQVPETEDLLEQEDDAPIIRLINAILGEAIKENASDIHLETFEKRLVVRFRVDGILREVLEPKRELAALLVSRVKVMARLDIAEKRVPQDGRISLKVGGREVDIRVSTLPSANGERVVLRLLDKQAGRLSLQHLGMRAEDRALMEETVRKPHGILLVTGPTGSGKTTTLYASLVSLNDHTRNILTVEDPIEYHLEGIGQTQVNTKVDMTFARGLRAILRQDPDVVMVGEIRDLETAEIAVQASLTGHLVLSTLHTNSAVGAMTRLRDMGIEPFLLSSSLLGVLAQRLVRVLDPATREAYTPSSSELAALGREGATGVSFYRPNAEASGRHAGYRGRTGLYELVMVDEALRQAIHDGRGEAELTKLARQRTPAMIDDGWSKLLAGTTSLDEVLRVTREDG